MKKYIVLISLLLCESLDLYHKNIENLLISASENYSVFSLNPSISTLVFLVGKEGNYPYLTFDQTTEKFSTDADYYDITTYLDHSNQVILPPSSVLRNLYFSVFSFSDIGNSKFNLTVQGKNSPFCADNCSGHGKCSSNICKCDQGFAGELCNVLIANFEKSDKTQTIDPFQFSFFYVETDPNLEQNVEITKNSATQLSAYVTYSNNFNSLPSFFENMENYLESEDFEIKVNENSKKTYFLLTLFCFSSAKCEFSINYSDLKSSLGSQMLILAVISALSLIACLGIPILIFYCYKRRTRNRNENISQLSVEEMNKLFPEQTCEPDAKEETCSICLDFLSSGAKIRKLKCTHMFHGKCIDEWVALHPTCPMCKVQLSK